MVGVARAVLLALAVGPTAATAWGSVPGGRPATLAILAFHDLSDAADAPALTVSPEALRGRIRAAKAAGWTFLRLSDVLERARRGAALPERTMVLTFDDAYRSFLDQALPILREESVPATLAVVSAWVDAPPAGLPPLLTWEQLAEVAASGLVEIASHSHDLHRWIVDNPWRDTSPAPTARAYLVEQGRYEDREEYRERIRRDMRLAQETLRDRLGRAAAIYVWPYGEHNEMARALAASAGFAATLELGHRAATAADLAAGLLPRFLVGRGTRLAEDDLARTVPAAVDVRAVQVDIDPLYDPDPQRLKGNVDALIERVRATGATHAILQVCPDPRGDARFRETWFANHQAPVRADVWSAVAARLRHAGLRVWARAPVINLPWLWKRHPDWRIRRDRQLKPRHRSWYWRVSPDLPPVRAAILDFYADLAVYLPLDGVLFDDDAFMLPDERLTGSGSAEAQAKSDALHELTHEIMRTVRAWRPQAQFGRNVYARVVEHDGVHALFSQDFDRILADYDLTVVMAYAHMEGHGDAAPEWIRGLVERAVKRWPGPRPAPILFKLQSYDWRRGRFVPAEELQRQVHEARAAGARHLGVYPVLPRDGALPPGLFQR